MPSNKKTNQKGFSLVELLIVIAIMGVLAVIAFNAFGSVLQNSRRRADDAQANNLQRALTLLVQETGIPNIVDNTRITIVDPIGDHSADTALSTVLGNGESHEYIMNLVKALQGQLSMRERTTGREVTFGPYLNNPLESGSAEFSPFAPQWNPDTGGRNVSYRVDIHTSTQNVIVRPVMLDDENVTTYDPKDYDEIDGWDDNHIDPGIFINDPPDFD